MHFLEPARFLNTPYLVGQKINLLSAPLWVLGPETTTLRPYSHTEIEAVGSWFSLESRDTLYSYWLNSKENQDFSPYLDFCRLSEYRLCSHMHKITNEPVFYMALTPYDFAAVQRHYLCNWKGWVMSLPRIKIITARAI